MGGSRKPGARLQVMTFNIRGGLGMDDVRSLERVAAVINEHRPDLVGLQEVHRRLPWSGMQDQPRRLAALTGLHAVFRPSVSFGLGDYGNCWLTRQRPVRSGRRRLPSGREPRAVLWLDLPHDGTNLRALVTHFGLGPEEQRRQAAALAALIRSSPGPLLLCGDLNVPPESDAAREVLGAGLRHAAPPDAPTYPADDPRHRIDYLLVSDHWLVESAAVIPTLASDHLPLLADLLLKQDDPRPTGEA